MEWSIVKGVRKELVIEKECKKKDTDERELKIEIINFESRVKKINVQLLKWKCVKNEMEKLNLNENDLRNG